MVSCHGFAAFNRASLTLALAEIQDTGNVKESFSSGLPNSHLLSMMHFEALRKCTTIT